MADERTHNAIRTSDYEAIEAAVMETERGRWFLKEYARRNRNSDTRMVLDAIEALGQKVQGNRDARSDMAAMVLAIAQAKSALRGDATGSDDDPFDSVPEALKASTEDLRLAAKQIAAENESVKSSAGERIGSHVARIEAAVALQDDALRRVETIIQTLRYLETRIHAMMSFDETPSDFAVQNAAGPRDLDEVHRPAFLM